MKTKQLTLILTFTLIMVSTLIMAQPPGGGGGGGGTGAPIDGGVTAFLGAIGVYFYKKLNGTKKGE